MPEVNAAVGIETKSPVWTRTSIRPRNKTLRRWVTTSAPYRRIASHWAAIPPKVATKNRECFARDSRPQGSLRSQPLLTSGMALTTPREPPPVKEKQSKAQKSRVLAWKACRRVHLDAT